MVFFRILDAHEVERRRAAMMYTALSGDMSRGREGSMTLYESHTHEFAQHAGAHPLAM